MFQSIVFYLKNMFCLTIFQGLNMKKTLIALAALSVAGLASAQVSITGEAAWGFYSGTSAAGATASGFGIDTAQLKFSASEDLGNGMKASAGLSLNMGQYGALAGAGPNADDQSISLTTPLATIALLTTKGADWVSQASGAATWYGLDGKVLSARSARDQFAVILPLATGLTLTAAYAEPANVLGEGTGDVGQSLYNFSVKYATGPATLQAAFLQYNNVAKSDVGSVGTDTVTRLGGKVDLGVATIGAGLQIGKLGAGGTNTQTALSVSAPLPGNFSVQAVFGSNNLDSSSTDARVAIGRRTGYMMGLQYNLSKRTYAILNAGSWTGQTPTLPGFTLSSTTGLPTNTATALANDTAATSMYALTLVHDF
jgi:hypothetical protein